MVRTSLPELEDVVASGGNALPLATEAEAEADVVGAGAGAGSGLDVLITDGAGSADPVSAGSEGATTTTAVVVDDMVVSAMLWLCSATEDVGMALNALRSIEAMVKTFGAWSAWLETPLSVVVVAEDDVGMALNALRSVEDMVKTFAMPDASGVEAEDRDTGRVVKPAVEPVKVADSVTKTMVMAEGEEKAEAREVSVVSVMEDEVVAESVTSDEVIGSTAVTVGRGAESVTMLSVVAEEMVDCESAVEEVVASESVEEEVVTSKSVAGGATLAGAVTSTVVKTVVWACTVVTDCWD